MTSVATNGHQGSQDSRAPAISANGRFVTFASNAPDLVPGDTNGRTDVFVRDRRTRTTVRVSVSASGVQGNDFSAASSISADRRFVTFSSFASNLVPGDTKGASDVFVYDRRRGAIERVSLGVARQSETYLIIPDCHPELS